MPIQPVIQFFLTSDFSFFFDNISCEKKQAQGTREKNYWFSDMSRLFLIPTYDGKISMVQLM